ncbi:ABC-type transport auxiliary lipoprotein family protein [Falsiroseomonas sp. HW251]|uniref:ABC-type transport auxiliary lipoprotein family protein n=1 Tax=Falsiroseomonas sp. HW251 TaxID=3390998 RepID=UPI003D30F458
MTRRALLLLPLLAGCSVLPERPFVPVRRFNLDPQRPTSRAAPRGAAVVLLRRVRGVPGLQDLGLRVANPDGSYSIAVYDQWLAPPGELAEAALRAWLQASGLFRAVVLPGSRAEATLAIEAQLTVLEAAPDAEEARAGLAGVLLREGASGSSIVTAFQVRGRAPMARDADAAGQAEAMEKALGDAFAELERALLRGAR